MNQNFSKSKFLQESSKLEHFQWGGKNFGGTNFGPLKSSGFHQLSYFQYFGLGVKIHQTALKRSIVISADIFAVLLRYFQSSIGNLIIINFI